MEEGVRVLFVSEKAGFFGGTEQNLSDTASGLSERGHRCFLAYGEKTTRGEKAFTTAFSAILPCRELGAESGNSFAQIVLREAPDLIFLHRVHKTDFLVPFIGKIPLVRMVHDHDLCCPLRHKYRRLTGKVCHGAAGFRCFLDLAFLAPGSGRFCPRFDPLGPKLTELKRNRNLDRILVASRFMLEELEANRFPADRLHVLPPVTRMPGGPTPPLQPEPRLLYVGQLVHGKGVDLLLRALRRMRHLYPLTIVGEGPDRQRLEALTRSLGLSGNVRFEGWAPHSELAARYARCWAVVIPSRWPEPFGQVGLEAMSRGRPVVGFAVGALPDWLEHEANGLLAPEQNVEILAVQLDRLLSSRDLVARMGAEGRRRYLERFRFDHYLDHLENHFKAVLSSAGRSAQAGH